MEHYAARSLLQWCTSTGHLVATTFFDIGHTFQGTSDQMRGSCIDHIVVPQAWRTCMRRASVLVRSGKRLQAAQVPRAWDHWPVQLVLELPRAQPAIQQAPSKVQWSREAARANLMEGFKRRELTDHVEDSLRQKADEILKLLREANTADEGYKVFMAAVQEASLKVLAEAPEQLPSQQRQENARELAQLLRDRRRAREQAVDAGEHGGELTKKYQERIVQLSRALKASKSRREEEKMELLVRDIWDSWRERKFHMVWKLARQIGGTTNPKFRGSGILSAHRTEASDWVERLCLEGQQGGCAGKVIDYDKECKGIEQATQWTDTTREDLTWARNM